MIELGFDLDIVALLRSLYADQQSAIDIEGELTDWFDVDKGVRQGCVLSPMLFDIYLEYIFRKINAAAAAEKRCPGIKFAENVINNILYADDGALIALGNG